MSETIRPDISVYQHAITVAKEVYNLTCKLPVQQRFVLTSQLRRSIILVCNRLSAVSLSETKPILKRNSELFIRVYAEMRTQIKLSLTLGHFTSNELITLEHCLDNILLYCQSNLQTNSSN
jgi:four helix bundle protein